MCGADYTPSYSKQRSCGRKCGLVTKYGEDLYAPRLSKRDLNAPLTAERRWLEELRKKTASAYMLSRYHADPANWTTARKRRRLFERDSWTCRICGKTVTDRVHRNADNRAVAGHILARATGGEWTDDNMATLCHPCNVDDGVNRVPIQTALAF